jgi:hypothetical protein
MKKSRQSKKKPAPRKAPEKFSYCVGRPWPINENNPDGTHIAVYAHHTEVQFGTMENAEGFKEYVDGKTNEENFIYKLVPVFPKKKKK